MEAVENPQKQALSAPGGAALTRPVAAALEYIEAHHCEAMSLDSISEHCFVSKYHLSHEFRRQMGTGVYQYILSLRLDTARAMLLEGTAPSRVFSRCGFRDYPGFYRAFRARFGMGPREYAALRPPLSPLPEQL